MTRRALLPQLQRLVEMALDEDLGRGDVTTNACVDAGQQARARLLTRESIVVSGLDVCAWVFQRIDERLQLHAHCRDGESVLAGARLLEVVGSARSILAGERVALNFLQRSCGVATHTRRFVEVLPPGTRTRIADTRKTTPGMRALEKQAVIDGGGHSHRPDLGGGVLIKENHIAACGSLERAVNLCRSHAPHTHRIEIEVRDLAQLEQALTAGADVVLLDNMSVETVEQAVALAAGRAILEASGNMSVDTVAAYARTGVDVISVGALTHSAPAADLTLLFEKVS